MIEFRIDDPEIETVYSSEEIIRLLKSIVRKEVEIVPIHHSDALLFTEVKKKLQDFFTDKPVIRAFLFGSYARGEERPDSDLDILVELDYSSPIGTKFFKMQSELEEYFRKKIDLLSLEAINENLRDSVLKDKVLVYERKS
jgi:uncharacterized protein